MTELTFIGYRTIKAKTGKEYFVAYFLKPIDSRFGDGAEPVLFSGKSGSSSALFLDPASPFAAQLKSEGCGSLWYLFFNESGYLSDLRLV